MEKIEVTTRFTRKGKLVPLEFSWGDKKVPVLNLGRQWETGEGRHLLVMDHTERTYHLFFQISDLSWYLVKDIKGPSGNLSEEQA
jgi:hypothetical protein